MFPGDKILKFWVYFYRLKKLWWYFTMQKWIIEWMLFVHEILLTLKSFEVFCFASFDGPMLAKFKQKMRSIANKLPLFLGLYFTSPWTGFPLEKVFNITCDNWMTHLVTSPFHFYLSASCQSNDYIFLLQKIESILYWFLQLKK